MAGKIIELVQGTPSWLGWRFSGIGGSDAPAVLGLSPYKTRRQLAREKIERKEAQDESKEFIFGRGHKFEKIGRQAFQELTGEDAKPVCMVHPKFSQLIVSLDGLTRSHGLFEAKHVGAEVLKTAAEKGEIPEHHLIQMQHGMNVADIDRGQWYGIAPSGDGVLIEVRRDENIIKPLQDAELELWDMIQAGQLPPLSDKDYLEPEDATLLFELRDAKEFMDNAEIEFDRLKKAAIDQYGHTRIAGAGLKLVKSAVTGSVEFLKIPEVAELVEKLKAEKPEYVESFCKASSSKWTLTVDKVKGPKK